MVPEPGVQGGHCLPPIFGRLVNPIPTGEGRLSPPITTGTPNVFQLPASLTMQQTINYWVGIKYTTQCQRKVWKYGGAKNCKEGLLREKVHFYPFLKFGVQLTPSSTGSIYTTKLLYWYVMNSSLVKIMYKTGSYFLGVLSLGPVYHFLCLIKNDTYQKRKRRLVKTFFHRKKFPK